jgi:hypothetical protein
VLATVLVNGQTKTVLIGAVEKNGGASSVIGAWAATASDGRLHQRFYFGTSDSEL